MYNQDPSQYVQRQPTVWSKWDQIQSIDSQVITAYCKSICIFIDLGKLLELSSFLSTNFDEGIRLLCLVSWPFFAGRTAQELAQVMGWNVDLEGTNWQTETTGGRLSDAFCWFTLRAASHEDKWLPEAVTSNELGDLLGVNFYRWRRRLVHAWFCLIIQTIKNNYI